ncbi:hypothetical protein RB623_16145 [Mesorhizobium sp. LHD-90]|nr:hypothetical protein [Mesorhizobium sp. LHD-90]MDQ6435590.1 hypothetical protein [Mesorhizobium sp. LHD-90]
MQVSGLPDHVIRNADAVARERDVWTLARRPSLSAASSSAWSSAAGY